MKTLILTAFLLAILAVLAWEGLKWFARLNIYQPSREPSGMLPAAFGFSCEHPRLRAEDGSPLDACYIREAPFRLEPGGKLLRGPLAASGLALLFCHGNAGNLTDRYVKASILQKLGLSILLFDYRGYGKSPGRPSEASTYADAEAAWRYLVETRGIPPDRIVLFGESLGTGVAVEMARRHQALALVLESPFTSTVDMGHLYFPRLPAGLIVKDRYDSLAKIPEIRCPVLILHSPKDDVVPYAMGRALFAAAPRPKRFADLAGDHNDGYLDAGEGYPKAILSFLEEALRGAD